MYSLTDLNRFSPCDFEAIRESGEVARQSLTSDVLATITTPEGWTVIPECRGEFGGLFPVQCRFSPVDNPEVVVCLCSPGELSGTWLLLLASPDGSVLRPLMSGEQCDPLLTAQWLARVAALCRFGCTPRTVATLLEEEVVA